MRSGRAARRAEVWRSIFRIGLGVFWLYFASQKWPAPLGLGSSLHGIGWMQPLMEQAARVNPVPVLHGFLVQVVVPNWRLFAAAQAAAETVVGVLLILGLATRPAALVATLLALNLSLTVAFTISDFGVRWLYYLPVLAGIEVLVNGGGAWALEKSRSLPAWLRA